MSNQISVEFLERYRFKQVQYPDGLFWVRRYTSRYVMQVSPCRSVFTDSSDEWVDDLTIGEFIDTVKEHQKAIDQ